MSTRIFTLIVNKMILKSSKIYEADGYEHDTELLITSHHLQCHSSLFISYNGQSGWRKEKKYPSEVRLS